MNISPDADKAAAFQLGMAVRVGLAPVLAVLAVWAVWDFPVAPALVAAVSIAYLVLIWQCPHAWLVALPALIPVYELGSWSGRILVTELDVLILLTLARHYMRGETRPAFPPIAGVSGLFGGLLAVSYAVSAYIGARDLVAPVADNLNFYIEPVNALRVAKGFFWAWLLWPLARAAAREAAQPSLRLVQGLGLGGGVLGLIALWEKGLFRTLLTADTIYAPINAVLDFAEAYRVTGLFSAMHVGGTATDGYLVLAVPMALAAAFAAPRLRGRLMFLAAFALGLYAAMMTFSRGLYGGVALAVVGLLGLYGAWFLRRHQGGPRILLFGAVAAGLGVAVLLLAYRWGGFESIFETAAIAAAAGLMGRYAPMKQWPGLVALAGLTLLGFAMVTETFAESRWSPLEGVMIYPASLLVATAAAIGGCGLGHVTRPVAVSALVSGGILALVFAALAVPAFSGYRMDARFSEVGESLESRQQHWSQAFTILERNGGLSIFGQGLGRYPAYYFWTVLGEETLPTARLLEQEGQTFMRIGSGDFSVMQRVSVEPDRPYTLTGRIRSRQAGRLDIALCHKNILFFDRYQPECVRERVSAAAGGEWQRFEVRFNSGTLGRYGGFYWPVNLILQNGRTGRVLDVTALRLSPAEGQSNLIANSDFDSGTARWILVSDFGHLAWHVKNLFLQVLFEQGVLGLLAVVGALACGLIRRLGAARTGDPAAAGFVAALGGFVVVAVFGSVIDNPTIGFVFFLVLLTACERSEYGSVPAESRDFPVDNPPARRHL